MEGSLWLPCFLLLYVPIVAVPASVKILNIGADCTGSDRLEVNDIKTYKIVWNSEDIPDKCRFRFSATSAVLQDDYKVCVEPTYYFVKDCNIQLSYYLGFDSYPENTFSCMDNPLKICGRIGEYFDIEIIKRNTRLQSTNKTSRFTLDVTAIQVYDHSDRQGLIGGIIGGVIGGIALIVIVGVIIILYNRRKRKRSEQNYTGRGYTNNGLDRTAEHKTNKLDSKKCTSKHQTTHENSYGNYAYKRDPSELTHGPIQLEPGEVMI